MTPSASSSSWAMGQRPLPAHRHRLRHSFSRRPRLGRGGRIFVGPSVQMLAENNLESSVRILVLTSQSCTLLFRRCDKSQLQIRSASASTIVRSRVLSLRFNRERGLRGSRIGMGIVHLGTSGSTVVYYASRGTVGTSLQYPLACTHPKLTRVERLHRIERRATSVRNTPAAALLGGAAFASFQL